MPVPGPRGQDAPFPGYRNPDAEQPDRINRWLRPGPVAQVGRTPNTMFTALRGNVLAAGTVRRLWRQVADMVPASASFSWTENAPAPGRGVRSPSGFRITTGLRYMTRSLYAAGGTDASRFTALHTKVQPKVHHKPVSVGSGQARSRPTVRNRLVSFGTRVPTLNQKVPAANE